MTLNSVMERDSKNPTPTIDIEPKKGVPEMGHLLITNIIDYF